MNYNFDGKKLKLLRKKKKLNISELSQILGKSPRTIGSWERAERKPSFSDIRVMCDFFGISVNEISNIEEYSTQKKMSIYESALSTEEKIQNLFEAKLNIEQKAFLYRLLGTYRSLKKNHLENNQEISFLREVLNSIPIAVYAKDFHRRYIYANDHWKYFSKIDNLIGKTDEQVLPNAIKKDMENIENKVFETHQTVYASTVSYNEDGYTKYISVSIFPKVKDSKIEMIVGCIIDVSQRMNALKQYKLFENIIDSLSSVVWVRYKKPIKHVVFLNSVIEKIVGFSQKEFNANPGLWNEIVHPEDQFAVKKWSDAWFKSPGDPTLKNVMRYRLIDKNGFPIMVNDFRSYFENEDGEKVEFGIIRDINTYTENS